MSTTKQAVTVPMLPLPNGAVFPDMVVTIALETDDARAVADTAVEDQMVLVPLADSHYARIGTLVQIENRGALPDETPALMVRALERVRIGVGVVGTGRGLWVEVDSIDQPIATERTAELAQRKREVASSLLDHIGGRQMASMLPDGDDPGALADTIAYWPELTSAQRVELLETIDVDARLELAIGWAEKALAEVEVTSKITQGVSETLESEQRDAILRRQLAAIRAELGEDEGDVVGEYRSRLEALELDDDVRKAIAKELDRLERTGDQGMESSWIRTWLDTVLEIPWGETAEE
jgi:ATP-dependent Lon protease